MNDTCSKRYSQLLRTHIAEHYQSMFREPSGVLEYPYIVPGSDQYATSLWDWDSWATSIALRQMVMDGGDVQEQRDTLKYSKGCVLNLLSYSRCGWVPIVIVNPPNKDPETNLTIRLPDNCHVVNMAKPVLAQHAALIVRSEGGDAEWLREAFYPLQQFLGGYLHHRRHAGTGLVFWNEDGGLVGDNDPCTFNRPNGSSGAIFLNTFLYKELTAMVYLAECLKQPEIGEHFQRFADQIKASILEYCWDERDGFFYSVDLNLKKYHTPKSSGELHHGNPCQWPCLIQRIGVWTGFLPMWAGIATPEQAGRMVKEHYLNERTFKADFGVRTLSKMEKMYDLRATGNPSSWLGPVWGISNYLVFRGLVNYGYEKEARALALATIRLFGRDVERFGAMHENYIPETGEPILNRGFQNWNYLVLNMLAWIEGRDVAMEF